MTTLISFAISFMKGKEFVMDFMMIVPRPAL